MNHRGVPAGSQPQQQHFDDTAPNTGRLRRWTVLSGGAVALAVLLAACGGDGGDQADTAGTAAPPEASPATPAAAGLPQSETARVTVDGTQRTYRSVLPAETGGPLPVVVALHDAGNTVNGMLQVTQFERAVAEGGFAVVLPAAAEEAQLSWNAGFCCGRAPAVGTDDASFLDAVLNDLAADDRFDAEQVHLTGVSNGGVMAYVYACQRAPRIAAVAVVAGTMDAEACQPSQPVSVLEIHGTADEVVPFDGGPMPDFVQATMPAISARALVESWAELNGCTGQPTTTTNPPVTRTTWQDCEEDATVALIAIEGAGHTWYAPGFGPADGAVDATAEIVDFFDLGG